jgi:hypothetical protein
MQLHHPFGVRVRHGQDLFANAQIDRQLFEDLTLQTRHVRLARLALAAGKFPRALEVRAAQPPGQQECAVALDDRGGHDDVRRGHAGSYG